jgi:MFS family permease
VAGPVAERSSGWPGGGPGSVIALTMVFGAFTADALMQTLLPASMQAAGVRSSVLIGWLLALGFGVGMLAAPPAALASDRVGRRRIIMPAGLTLAAGAGLLALAYRAGAVVAALPVLVFGIGRGILIVTSLAMVGDVGRDQYGIQGLNGAAQRLSALLAAVIAAVILSDHDWSAGMLAVMAVGLTLSALSLTGRDQVTPVVPATGSHLSAYLRSLRVLRGERRLWASSLLNLHNNVSIVLGNSFLPITLAVARSQLGLTVLILLAARDLTATAVGLAFRRLGVLLGVGRTVASCAACTTGGLVILGLSGMRLVPLIALGTALQGIALALSISSTNLLATAGHADKGLRIAASQYVNIAGTILLPVVFGVVLGLAGARGLFLLGAVIAGGLAALAALLLLRRTDHLTLLLARRA